MEQGSSGEVGAFIYVVERVHMPVLISEESAGLGLAQVPHLKNG